MQNIRLHGDATFVSSKPVYTHQTAQMPIVAGAGVSSTDRPCDDVPAGALL